MRPALAVTNVSQPKDHPGTPLGVTGPLEAHSDITGPATDTSLSPLFTVAGSFSVLLTAVAEGHGVTL